MLIPEKFQTEAGTSDGMVRIEGGRFLMGSDQAYPEEGPAHPVEVSSFWIDAHAVTNAAFARFIAATGYLTFAERPIDPADFPNVASDKLRPGGIVFRQPASRTAPVRDLSWWSYVPGACWRHPDGPETTIDGKENDPVVQIAYEDATAYAAWCGKRLPSEAEWEFAARGGLSGALYCWGDELNPDGRWMANSWQGSFPMENSAQDGFAGRAPVGSFPANGYGLYDMAGNVWEWTGTDYTARHTSTSPCCTSGQQAAAASKVIKGGSFLCAPNYCLRYRPAARQPQTLDSATCHVGFRCARD